MESIFKTIVITLLWWIFVCLYALFGMWLWNWLMPEVFGLPTINWLQMLVMMILANIIFRGINIKYENNRTI